VKKREYIRKYFKSTSPDLGTETLSLNNDVNLDYALKLYWHNNITSAIFPHPIELKMFLY